MPLRLCLARVPILGTRSRAVVFGPGGVVLRVLSYDREEYLVVRHGSRKWEVRKDGEVWWFGSRWELLAWFGDRL